MYQIIQKPKYVAHFFFAYLNKKSSRILSEDKDKYLLNPRAAKKKWVTIELSEEIMMHSIALANYEYYSCSVKEFHVLGSTQYPVCCKNYCCYLVSARHLLAIGNY